MYEQKTIRILYENYIIPPDDIDWNGIGVLACDIENMTDDFCHETLNAIYSNAVYSILEKLGISKKDYDKLVKREHSPKTQERLKKLRQKLIKTWEDKIK